jgi:hypothetical protein
VLRWAAGGPGLAGMAGCVDCLLAKGWLMTQAVEAFVGLLGLPEAALLPLALQPTTPTCCATAVSATAPPS